MSRAGTKAGGAAPPEAKAGGTAPPENKGDYVSARYATTDDAVGSPAWTLIISGCVSGVAFEFSDFCPDENTVAEWESFARGEQDLDYMYNDAHVEGEMVRFRDGSNDDGSGTALSINGEPAGGRAVAVPLALITEPLLATIGAAVGAGLTFALDDED